MAAFCPLVSAAPDPVQNVPFFLEGSAQEWIVSYYAEAKDKGVRITLDALEHAFLLQFADTRRHTAPEARERLHRGECMMRANDTVA